MSSVNKINRECPVWEKLLIEVNDAIEHEPDLKEFFTKAILDFSNISS